MAMPETVLKAALTLAIGALASMMTGCAGSDDASLDARAGLSCVDDTPECVSRRQTTLKSMTTDATRAWIKEPASPEAYASGVRLFAFKAKKKELSCDELAHGRREAEAAGPALAGAGTRLTPAQAARGRMLASEVARELAGEFNRRCKKA